VQIVLGWELNTRGLLILLPFNKFEAWTNGLQSIVTPGKTTFGELESTAGRLNHAGYVIPLSPHFLKRLRLRISNRRPKNQQITLTIEEIRDLQQFLQQARSGISLNCITIRRPSKLGWSNSCPFGPGGFLLSGRAWRVQIIFGVDIANVVSDLLSFASSVRGYNHPLALDNPSDKTLTQRFHDHIPQLARFPPLSFRRCK
jgi:hypothetical protein